MRSTTLPLIRISSIPSHPWYSLISYFYIFFWAAAPVLHVPLMNLICLLGMSYAGNPRLTPVPRARCMVISCSSEGPSRKPRATPGAPPGHNQLYWRFLSTNHCPNIMSPKNNGACYTSAILICQDVNVTAIRVCSLLNVLYLPNKEGNRQWITSHIEKFKMVRKKKIRVYPCNMQFLRLWDILPSVAGPNLKSWLGVFPCCSMRAYYHLLIKCTI